MRAVKYVKLHSTVFLPGVGDLTATLPPTTKNYQLELSTCSEGIFIKRGEVEAVVPWANVQCAVLGPELPTNGTKTPSK